MDKTDRLRDYGLAFLLYEHGLGICGYELIRELFIVFIKLILNSYLDKHFYLLFVPIIRDIDFVYPKCKFVDMFNEYEKIFQNRQEFYDDEEIYFPQKITLEAKYKGFDLLYPQGSDVFFSERVINAFEKEKVIGYDIITGGCFYSDIEFG